MTLSAALPFLECPARQPLPPGVIGEELEMGETRPIEARRGPVEVDTVIDGDESDVSIEGGAVGRWLGTSGDASGVPLDGILPCELSGRPSGDMGRAICVGDCMLCKA